MPGGKEAIIKTKFDDEIMYLKEIKDIAHYNHFLLVESRSFGSDSLITMKGRFKPQMDNLQIILNATQDVEEEMRIE